MCLFWVLSGLKYLGLKKYTLLKVQVFSISFSVFPFNPTKARRKKIFFGGGYFNDRSVGQAGAYYVVPGKSSITICI